MYTEAGRGPRIPWDWRYRWFVSCHVGAGDININLHVELVPISLGQLFICICRYEEKTNIFLGVVYMFTGVSTRAQALWMCVCLWMLQMNAEEFFLIALHLNF